MDVGLSLFHTAETLPPAAIARLAEELGFESLFAAEHTHIPASRQSPFPGGGPLPDVYARSYDPFVALAAAAAATERIRLGTAVCLVNQRDPIVTAKQVATLDQVSSGRFVFGVGAGWNREEMANHGVDPRTRFRLLRERVEAMKAIWTEDEASYEGEFVRFERIWCWPKPVQRPHPPVLLGNGAPAALDRVLTYADGWLPGVPDDDERLAQVTALRARADRPLSITFVGVAPDERRLARYEEAGIDRVVFLLPAEPPDATRARVEELAQLAARFASPAHAM